MVHCDPVWTFRRANQAVKPDALPAHCNPVAEPGRLYFSKLDLMADSFRVRFAENAKQETAFATLNGLYEFSVLSG